MLLIFSIFGVGETLLSDNTAIIEDKEYFIHNNFSTNV